MALKWIHVNFVLAQANKDNFGKQEPKPPLRVMHVDHGEDNGTGFKIEVLGPCVVEWDKVTMRTRMTTEGAVIIDGRRIE